MTACGVKALLALVGVAAVAGVARGQTIVAAPSAVAFTYQMGATPLIQQQKVVVTLPASLAGQTVKITNVVVALYQGAGTTSCSPLPSNTACGWLR